MEERCAGGDGDCGLAVAVGCGEEAQCVGDYGTVGKGPGKEVIVG